MIKKISKILSLYLFAYKYILKVNCFFALPALGIYCYLLFRYQGNTIDTLFTDYIVSTVGHKIYINGELSDSLFVNIDQFYKNALLYQNILFFIIPFCILLLYMFILVAFVRDLSSRYFIIKRTGKLVDDVGFAITFCSLTSLFNILFAINVSGIIYILIASFIQCTAFLFVLQNQAYGYSIKKRSKKIIT